MKVYLLAAAFCGLILAATQADAAVEFNLRRAGFGKTITQTAPNPAGGNVSLTLTASAAGAKKDPYVVQTGFGTGIYTPKGDNSLLTALAVDGLGPNETLHLTFNKSFKIETICFNWVDKKDSIIIRDGNGTILFNDKLKSPLLTLNVPFSTSYSFTAPDSKSEWLVTAVKGQVIPEPSTALIWSALGVGALVWRRRKTALQKS